MSVSRDSTFMQQALDLATQTNPAPNPKVGAIIVKSGRVIASGFHVKAGLPHAEVIALNQAGKNARGATLYVTLEPCTHYGRTPPCIDAVIASKVKRVVIAMKDPNPRVHGKGIALLKRAGIAVTVGICEEEAQRINERFIHFMKTGMPFVCIKTAMSLDGKIATRTGDSRGLSGKEEQDFVQHLRASYQAILVGVNTVLRDNPRLSARVKGARQPVRIILDSMLRIPLRAAALKDHNVIIATSSHAPKSKLRALEQKGIIVLSCGKNRVDVKRLLHQLGKLQIISILVEGGSEVNASFIEAGCVQKMHIAISPKIVGGRDAKTLVGGRGIAMMRHAIKLKRVEMDQLGEDMFITGYLQ